MPFPEEALDLPASEGGGYYPTAIHQKLNGEKYEVVRKLGHGTRSSTWLVFREQNPAYFAVKIFNVAASERAKSMELPIIQMIRKLDPSLGLPVLYETFWESSSMGSHLCLVLYPLSTSVEALQRSAINQRLPVHAAQKIVSGVAKALKGLHAVGIMHGAIKADNIYFSRPTQARLLKPVLDSEPEPTTIQVKNFVTVQSQPLKHNFKWNDKKKTVADWPLHIDNLGHAQQGIYHPEKETDYLSAPESLLFSASCSLQTDIWMLGILAYKLLTGKNPFHPSEDASKQLASMRAVLDDEFPEAWLADSYLKNSAAVPISAVNLRSIDVGLADALHRDEVASASVFIKGCIRLNPQKRLTAEECVHHDWLSEANACSCGFC